MFLSVHGKAKKTLKVRKDKKILFLPFFLYQLLNILKYFLK